MPVTLSNLSVLSYANGFTLWHYKAPSSFLLELHNPRHPRHPTGYFNDAIDQFAHGDMIIANARDGATVLVVASTANGEVRTAGLK